jgi:hypothetical protein
MRVIELDGGIGTEIRGRAQSIATRRMAIEQLHALQLDVLVWADIGMDSKTYFLAHSRSAPVQLAFFGHPITSGLPAIDYYVTSELIERDVWQRFGGISGGAAFGGTGGADKLEPNLADKADSSLSSPQWTPASYFSEQLILLPRLATYYLRSQLPSVHDSGWSSGKGNKVPAKKRARVRALLLRKVLGGWTQGQSASTKTKKNGDQMQLEDESSHSAEQLQDTSVPWQDDVALFTPPPTNVFFTSEICSFDC